MSRTGGGGGGGTLETGLEKVNKMINWGRRAGYTQAALNLEQWRDGKGDRVMPAASFQSQSFLLKHLETKHLPEFIKGARKRLASGVLGPGKTAEMDWTDSVNAPLNSDLWFALGGFTVHSHVKVQLVAGPGGNGQVLRFMRWETDISDVYDWDAGKVTSVPGLGTVTDDEMLALEKAGKGKAFKITSERAVIVNTAITRDVALP